MASWGKGAKHSVAVAAALVESLDFDMPVIPRPMSSSIKLDHPFRCPITAMAIQQQLDAIRSWGGQGEIHPSRCCAAAQGPGPAGMNAAQGLVVMWPSN